MTGPVLETIAVDALDEAAAEIFAAALGTACGSVGLFLDEATGLWRAEGVRAPGAHDAELGMALALAAVAAGITPPPLLRVPVAAEGWLARTRAAFPPLPVGREWLILPTHLGATPAPGRITLRLDAGIAFGSGEHGSTQGCLLALSAVAPRLPRHARVLDLGTGSGVLAIAAARRLRRPVLATDIDPWAVRNARENAARNGVGRLVTARTADGWHGIRGRHDLVLANILARPLCAMARPLAHALAPGGRAILAGLLDTQARWVLAAHRRQGLALERTHCVGRWATLTLRKRA